MPKLLRPGVTTETEVARIKRDEQAGLAELGLRLDEAKQLTAALQAQIVPAPPTTIEGRRQLRRDHPHDFNALIAFRDRSVSSAC